MDTEFQDAVLLWGEDDPCSVAGEAQHPWHREPCWEARRFPSARLIKQQPCSVLP